VRCTCVHLSLWEADERAVPLLSPGDPTMHIGGSTTQSIFVLRALDGHVSRLATAAAMLICVAIILNVGPFSSEKAGGGPGQKSALAISQGSIESSWILGPDVEESRQQDSAQAAAIKTMVPSEIVKDGFELVSTSAVVDVVTLASQPFARKDDIDEPQSAALQQELTNPTARPGSKVATQKVNFVGVWAPDADSCSMRLFRQGTLPTFIYLDGAWAGETFCAFKEREQTETGWKVVARCASSRERWTANVRLTVNGNHLTWTSGRGTQSYARCETDVLMADVNRR
jgi:hypothetical protein